MTMSGDQVELARRVGRRTGVIAVFANLDGAVFVFVYLTFAALQEPSSRGDVAGDVALFVAYLVASGAVGYFLGYRAWRRGLAWMLERRPPTEAERAATLRLPFKASARALVGWVGAAVLFGVARGLASDSVGQAIRVADTILLGGVVSCAVAFLMLERVYRPVFAIALRGEPPARPSTLGIRPRLLLAWALGSGIPLGGLVSLPLLNKRGDIDGAVVMLAGVGLLAGFLVIAMVAKSLADPLDQVRAALDEVKAGSLDVDVPVDDGGEVGLLQSGVNRMVEGLRERQRLADLFGRQVGVDVARLALEQGTGLASEQREASALFVDLIGSTAMTEVLAPESVVDTLNAFFGAVVRVVTAEGGWVNKFEGDGALCVFGAPAVQPDHAARALRAARALELELSKLAGSHPGLEAAIGVSAGPLVAGNVGTEQRYEYTVIGRPVNEAARLSDLAKGQRGRVLASAGAVERAGGEAREWVSLGTVALRGQAAPTAIYEPLGVRQPVS